MSDFLIEEIKQIVTNDNELKPSFMKAWEAAEKSLESGLAFELIFKPKKKTRSTEANACMWAHLQDVSRQVIWHGNTLTPEEWKDLFTACLRSSKSAPAIGGGGFVVVGARTSKMSIQEMGNLIEIICAFGAENVVKFSAPKWMWGDD